MEAEKVHNLSSASWQRRKEGGSPKIWKLGGISLESGGLKPRNSDVQQQEKMDAQEDRQEIHPSFDFLFYLCLLQIGWCSPKSVKADFFFPFSLLNQMLFSCRNSFADTPRNNVLPVSWACLSSHKLTPKINRHNAPVRKWLCGRKDYSRMSHGSEGGRGGGGISVQYSVTPILTVQLAS